MEGRYFGDLVVLRREGHIGKHAAWRCRCACGIERVVPGFKLRAGNLKSCGQGHYYKHPMLVLAKAELRVWGGMIQRCHNPKNNPAYKRYGGRGISVCARWREDFSQFLSDLGPRPGAKHSIDRYPNRNGNYEPGNCRWATVQEQADNKDGRVRVVVDGKEVLLRAYLRERGITHMLVRKRLERGWTIDEALAIPTKCRRDDTVEWIAACLAKDQP